MKHKLVRIMIGVLAAFIALSAIGGGIAMLSGADHFPIEWLRNTPFSDYTIPALVLVIVVGGSSLVAAASVFISREMGVVASMVAGLMMVGYLVVEVLSLPASARSWYEGMYFGSGLLIIGLATYLWMAEARRLHFHAFFVDRTINMGSFVVVRRRSVTLPMTQRSKPPRP